MSSNYKSQDEKIEKLSKILKTFADNEGVEFVFEGHPLKNIDVFGHYGALSLFLVEAQEIYEKIANGNFSTTELLGTIVPPDQKPKMRVEDLKKDEEWMENKRKNKEYIFPISYYTQEENTFFSFIPRVSEEIPCDFYLIAHYTHYALDEYVKKYKLTAENGKIPLDELYNKMLTKINDRKLNLVDKEYIAPAKHMSAGANE